MSNLNTLVLPEPVTWLIERSAFRVSPHGQDAESNEWLEEAHEPGEEGSFPVYTEQQVRALLATGGKAQAVEVLGWVHKTKRGKIGNHFYTYEPHCDTAVRDDGGEKIAVIAASGAAPQAQAVERGEVLVTVSGFTGSGKSAIAGEIEILCRALGLQVDWPGGDSEKNMTHADWTAALEQYKPRVRIVEHNVPTSESKNDH